MACQAKSFRLLYNPSKQTASWRMCVHQHMVMMKLTISPPRTHASAEGRDQFACPAHGLVHTDFQQAHGLLAGVLDHLNYHKSKGLQVLLGRLQHTKACNTYISSATSICRITVHLNTRIRALDYFGYYECMIIALQQAAEHACTMMLRRTFGMPAARV